MAITAGNCLCVCWVSQERTSTAPHGKACRNRIVLDFSASARKLRRRGSSAAGPPNKPGTPIGTYPIGVTASSASVSPKDSDCKSDGALAMTMKVTRSELEPAYKLSEATLEIRSPPWRILTRYRSRFSRIDSSPSRKRWDSSSENRASLPTSRRDEITLAPSSTHQDS